MDALWIADDPLGCRRLRHLISNKNPVKGSHSRRKTAATTAAAAAATTTTTTKMKTKKKRKFKPPLPAIPNLFWCHR